MRCRCGSAVTSQSKFADNRCAKYRAVTDSPGLNRIKPKEALIVEDAPHSIDAARRSGAVLCQVTGFNEVDYSRIKRSLEGAG